MKNFFEDNFIKNNAFMYNSLNYEQAKKIIFGAPMDFTVTFRAGSRFAPNKIREMSENLEEYSPYFKKQINEISFADIGNLKLPFGNADNSLKVIYNSTLKILKDKKVPVCLGGEHLISLPIIKAVAEQYQDIVVLHFDAHADLRDNYEGEELSHSTVIKKITSYVRPENIYSFGIRSGTFEEFAWAEQNINFYPFKVLESFEKVIDKLNNKKIYITVDLDVFDPSVFPGTGTPEAGGITFNEFIEVLRLISNTKLNVVGFDLVELCPLVDHSDISGALASKLLREMLICL